jgi:hypothetical protein
MHRVVTGNAHRAQGIQRARAISLKLIHADGLSGAARQTNKK